MYIEGIDEDGKRPFLWEAGLGSIEIGKKDIDAIKDDLKRTIQNCFEDYQNFLQLEIKELRKCVEDLRKISFSKKETLIIEDSQKHSSKDLSPTLVRIETRLEHIAHEIETIKK